MINTLAELQFVDLYLGPDYCDIKGLKGSGGGRVAVPPELAEQIAALRERCEETYSSQGEPEFALVLDKVLFRVTMFPDLSGGHLFVLRRSTAELRSVATLGLPPHVIKVVLDKDAAGAILVAGKMAQGKTSTAGSIVRERTKLYGGISITIEHPVELPLQGVYGDGRIIQVPVVERDGGYREAIRRAMRSGADLMMIGEIRSAEPAEEVALASINGQFIISTIHGGSVVDAIERFQTYCKGLKNGNDLMANGLAVVIHQELVEVPNQPHRRLNTSSLVIRDDEGVKTKIREGRISQLQQDVEDQSKRAQFNIQKLIGGRS
ncbi:type II secretion system protein E [Burkholderia pseudomallei]|nr:type II secretion system protein E [Burkholderia pseudomallei]